MSKHILLKTNLFVSIIIIIGFAAIFTIGYNLNLKVDKEKIEQISTLTSEGIYYRIRDIFTEPLGVSLTMANDSLLIAYLLEEDNQTGDYSQTISDYLSAYENKYGYDSIFLVSSKNHHYYTFNGFDRLLADDNPENDWYYSFLESNADYSLNVDNDEAALNEITVFVNCRITGNDGTTLGVVGVGFKVEGLQLLLRDYAQNFGVEIYLIDRNGKIEIAIDDTGWQPKNFFDNCGYPQLKDEILANVNQVEVLNYWHSTPEETNFIISRFIPKMEWHLIVEHDTSSIIEKMNRQLFIVSVAVFIIISIVVIAITYTISRYNKEIILLTALIEEKKHDEIKKHLVHKAEIDGMTELYNKKATEHYISKMLTDNPSTEFAFFMLDLDNLKTINDEFGHAFGDFVITEFANTIRNHFGDCDVVGRIGGDEFAAFFTISGIDIAYAKAKALSEALAATFSDGSISYVSSASIGIAVAPRDGMDFETLYKNADKALYDVKQSGKNGYAFYHGVEKDLTKI